MNSVGSGGMAMYGRLVGEDQLVNMSTAANNSALYPKPQYHTPIGRAGASIRGGMFSFGTFIFSLLSSLPLENNEYNTM